MLLIFDNDGTICDTQQVEGRCYAIAIERVTGMSLASVDWSTFHEPTSSAIVRHLLAADIDWEDKEKRIEQEFCRLLEEARPQFPADFSPIYGAIQFIERLRSEGAHVAIATGGFNKEAEFKLACCGLKLGDFPHATASDTPRRRDIIRLACARAGFEIDSVVYFGDAPWDARVSSELGIPMIGIGRRCEQLRQLGVSFAFPDYRDPESIMTALRIISGKMPRKVMHATCDDAHASALGSGIKVAR
jgi:beta-phosphoglucomutase-like phosphatase (HAD superfamily)